MAAEIFLISCSQVCLSCFIWGK